MDINDRISKRDEYAAPTRCKWCGDYIASAEGVVILMPAVRPAVREHGLSFCNASCAQKYERREANIYGVAGW